MSVSDVYFAQKAMFWGREVGQRILPSPLLTCLRWEQPARFTASKFLELREHRSKYLIILTILDQANMQNGALV